MDVRPDSYDWAGGREAMLRFGPEGGPTVVVAPALFEEGNRTRAIVVGVLRRLAARGIGSILPDLPGTGDSLLATSEVTMALWRAAFAVVAGHQGRAYGLAVRGGSLVDTEAPLRGRWRLAPMTVAEVERDVTRLRSLNSRGDVGGNRISPRLFDITPETPPAAPCRTVRVGHDPRPADRLIAGIAPWRLAEPAADPALSDTLSIDIAEWIARCEA